MPSAAAAARKHPVHGHSAELLAEAGLSYACEAYRGRGLSTQLLCRWLDSSRSVMGKGVQVLDLLLPFWILLCLCQRTNLPQVKVLELCHSHV